MWIALLNIQNIEDICPLFTFETVIQKHYSYINATCLCTLPYVTVTCND